MNLGGGKRRDDEVDINVTSFIDVLLLLLIFFMMATSFVSEGRVNIRLPEASANSDNPEQRRMLEIGVDVSGAYRLDGKELANNSPDTLRAAIEQAVGEQRDLNILIRADARATHQSVVTAMDVVGRAGFKAISIATINQPAEKSPAK